MILPLTCTYARVAVKAGVKSAVATLWYVDDQATSWAHSK